MDCSICKTPMRSIQYEGIEIETCDGCGGEWLDADELRKVIDIREVRFDEDEQRAIAESAPITGVKIADVDRHLTCPGCGHPSDPIVYGGDTGIVVDRCTGCGGFWLDAAELEKVQMVVAGWEDALPEDLKKYGPRLRDIEVAWDKEDDVTVSRSSVLSPLINMLVNGIIDLTT